jgi:hypothetical protein
MLPRPGIDPSKSGLNGAANFPISEEVPLTQLTPLEPRFDIPVELHSPGPLNRVTLASIQRAGHSFFEVSCAEPLEDGQRLLLIQGGRRIVVDVVARPGAHADFYKLAVVEDKSGAARADRRVLVDLPATLHIAGETESIRVRVSDMSASGMGIELFKALPLGTRVCVSFTEGLAFGEVRFCRQKAADCFVIGFRLEEYIA